MSSPSDDEKMDRDHLAAAWPADEPSAGFAARVTAAAEAEAAARTSPSKRRRGWWVGVALVATAAAIALALQAAPVSTSVGERLTAARETIALGQRGLAVAEAESALKWRVDGSGADVEQTAGDVFYRVEKGGPFVVRTPAGEVRVTGTCFRVEVDQMSGQMSGPMKKSLMQMGAGAAIASAVLVTVYEGKVILANEKGQTQLAAGEQAHVGRGQAPSAASDARAPFNAALASAPAEGITREELLKRDQQQRAELEKLRSRVHQLEASNTGGAGGGSGKRESFLNTTKDEIQAMAKDCKLKWDQPSINAKPETVSDDEVKEFGLTEQERAEINRVNAEVTARVTTQLRQLYVEVTGDKAGAEILAPRALEQEIMEKSSEKDAKQAFYNISHERAGMQPPPGSADAQPPVERLLRLVTSLGDTYERDLGKAIGPDLAHRIRADRGGWGSRSVSSMGCPQ